MDLGNLKSLTLLKPFNKFQSMHCFYSIFSYCTPPPPILSYQRYQGVFYLTTPMMSYLGTDRVNIFCRDSQGKNCVPLLQGYSPSFHWDLPWQTIDCCPLFVAVDANVNLSSPLSLYRQCNLPVTSWCHCIVPGNSWSCCVVQTVSQNHHMVRLISSCNGSVQSIVRRCHNVSATFPCTVAAVVAQLVTTLVSHAGPQTDVTDANVEHWDQRLSLGIPLLPVDD